MIAEGAIIFQHLALRQGTMSHCVPERRGVGITETPGENKQGFGHAVFRSLMAPEIRRLQN